tara:strand:+ start:1593 stop:6038 length:4446 start_codon:yes stop_codon:yes gene_type:complete
MKDQFGGIIVEEPNKKPLVDSNLDKFGGIILDSQKTTGAISFGNVGPDQVPVIKPNIQQQNQAALSNVVDLNLADPQITPLAEEADQQYDQMMELAQMRFDPETIKSWENNPIGFQESFGFLDWEDVTPVAGGVAKGANYLKLLDISKNIEAGKPVTPSDSEFLNEFVDKQVEMKIRGMSYGGKIAYYGSPLPAFMVEFALTGGIGKAAQATTLKAIGTAVETTALKTFAAKTTGRVARVAAQSAVMVPMLATKYGERRAGAWNVTNKGEVIFSGANESPAMSALMAYAHVSAEVASELSGATLNKYLINPVTKRLKTPLINGINKLPEKLKLALYDNYKRLKGNARVSRVFTAGGWNGMLAELGEERIADILRETTNLTLEEGYTFDQVLDGITPSKDQLLLEAGLISIMGGGKTITSVVMNFLTSDGLSVEQAQEIVDNLTVLEQEALASEFLTVETYDPDLDILEQENIIDLMPEFLNEIETTVEIDVIENAVSQIEALEQKLIPLQGSKVIAGDRNNIGTVIAIKDNIATVLFTNKKTGTTATKQFTNDQISPVGGKAKTNAIIKEIKQLEAIINKAEAQSGLSPIEQSVVAEVQNYVENMDARVDDLLPTNSIPLEVEPRAVAPEASIFNEFYYKWFDKLGSLIDLAKESRKRGKTQKTGERLELLVRMYAGVVDMASTMITNKTFVINAEGNIEETGAGLQSILDDFDSMVIPKESNRKQRLKDFEDYLIARRYLEDLVGREDVTVTDQQKADSLAAINNLTEKYGETIEVFDTFAQEIYGYQQRILKMLVDGGNMAQETYDSILSDNPNYIPFQRVMEKEYGAISKRQVFSNASLNKVIKKIVGSELDIKSPIQQILSNTFRIADLAWQNRIATSISSMAEAMPEYIEKIKIPRVPVKDKDGNILKNKDGTDVYRQVDNFDPKNAITVFVNGKKQFYKVDKAILTGIEQMRPDELGFITKFFSFPATVLRAGATLVPEFWLKNVIRDMWGAFIMNPDRPTPIDTVKGLTAIMGNSELYKQWMQSGGSFNSYMELNDNGLAKAQKELLNPKGRIAKYLTQPWKMPGAASLALEQSVRVGVYAAAKKAGKSDLEAGYESRDATLDFARGGSASKKINRFVPFFNAGMQGADKLYRSMRDNPKATTMYALATITMPSILITGYYLHGASEEEKKEYLEIPQWQRDTFWVFKANGEWRRVPKPFSLGYIFGSTPERFLMWMDSEGINDGKKFWVDTAKGLSKSVSPVPSATGLLPPSVRVAIESITNYNFYQGRNIYPNWMDTLSPEKRKTKGTSETAIALGKQFEMSPALVDNALRGTFASGAEYITDAGDIILNSVKKWNEEEIPETPTSPMDIPIVRAFTVRDPTGNVTESVRIFYDLVEQAGFIKSDLKDLKGKEKSQYKKDNQVIYKSRNAIKFSAKKIARLNKKRNVIYESLSLNADQKRDRLKQLDDRILAYARRANDKVDKELRRAEKEQ